MNIMIDQARLGTLMKHMVQILIVVLTIFSFTSASAFSQTNKIDDIATVAFRDGTIIQGHVVQMNVDTITIWTPDDDIIIREFNDVERITTQGSFDLRGGARTNEAGTSVE